MPAEWSSASIVHTHAGHIQLIVPGETACFECTPPLTTASDIHESTLMRGGLCTASLPTTTGVIAGLLAHNTLKYLLGFGTVTKYLDYSSLTDCFSHESIRGNQECKQPRCIELQAKQQCALAI
jgi:ubiquitin-like modifier-activating enzyme 5